MGLHTITSTKASEKKTKKLSLPCKKGKMVKKPRG
jgi:hypothetical protein